MMDFDAGSRRVQRSRILADVEAMDLLTLSVSPIPVNLPQPCQPLGHGTQRERRRVRGKGGLCNSRNGLSLGGRTLVVSRHERHCIKYTVTPDERMEKCRADMQQDQRKEHECKVKVRIPKQRMHAVALR